MTTETRDWSATRERIEKRWPGLPAEDLEASKGERGALLALLQGRLGYARPNAEQDLDEILRGASIVPEDVADAETHTGSSGPVAAPSGGPAGAWDERPAARAAELPNQPSEATVGPTPVPPTFGGMPERGAHEGGTSMGNGGGDRDRFDPWRGGDGGERHKMPMIVPPKVLAIAGALGTVLVIGLLVRRKRRTTHTRTEQVAEQARHLIEEIHERMPSVEELRDKVRSLDELREKRAAAMHRR